MFRRGATSANKCNAVDAPFKTGETKRIFCQRYAAGRFVRIRQQAPGTGMLVLCEVEVYGTMGKTTM